MFKKINQKDTLLNTGDKLINSSFYVQNLVRRTWPANNNKIVATDNHSNIQRAVGLKASCVGEPLNTQKKKLSNKFNSNFKILTSLGFKNPKGNDLLKNYESNFKNLIKIKSKSNLVTITKIIKGGANGITAGTTGFIPKSHCSKAIRGVLVSKKNQLSSYFTLKKLSRIITPKIPLKKISISIYPSTESNKFKNNKTIKKFYAKSNIVFTRKKEILKKYENKKKTRKHKDSLLPKEKNSFSRRKSRRPKR